MFSKINLTNKATLKRVKLCLLFLEGQDVFDRHDLDKICGRRNKPLGWLLRICFKEVDQKVDRRNGEIIEYVPHPILTKKLRDLMNSHELTQHTN